MGRYVMGLQTHSICEESASWPGVKVIQYFHFTPSCFSLSQLYLVSVFLLAPPNVFFFFSLPQLSLISLVEQERHLVTIFCKLKKYIKIPIVWEKCSISGIAYWKKIVISSLPLTFSRSPFTFFSKRPNFFLSLQPLCYSFIFLPFPFPFFSLSIL